MDGDDGVPLGAGGRAFRALGRGIVRRPWLPIAVWVVLLLLGVPLLLQLGTATQNSAANVPSTAPSAQAAAELARLFPSTQAPSATYVVITGSDLTDPAGQRATLAVAGAIANDSRLSEVAGVATLYSAYAGYLTGEFDIVDAYFAPPAPSPVAAASGAAEEVWGPPAAFVATWQALVAAHANTSASTWNYPAYAATAANLTNTTLPLLAGFYNGISGGTNPTPGFNRSTLVNGTGDCAATPAAVAACADATARLAEGPLLGLLTPNGSGAAFPATALADLGIGNYTAAPAVAATAFAAVARESGLPVALTDSIGQNRTAGELSTVSAVAAWANRIADGPVAAYPLPIPASVAQPFLAPDGSASLIVVSFAVSDSTTVNGQTPDFNDVDAIASLAPGALTAAAPNGGYGLYQTGPAPLDEDESNVLSSNLAIVLPLTIAILFLITLLYFRAPLAPVVTFSGLGVAIGLGLAGLVVITKLFGKVDPTSLTLENTFVLGVGTDYSIFLMARYREELRKGVASPDAVVTAVTWAGQSVATSGGTAVLATLALAFSGVGLLAQWGETLSLAVLATVLIALTLIPALLALLGPRVFWPEVGARATAARAEAERRWAREDGYFFRAGRRVQRQPIALILVILAVSVPLVYVAIESPLGYDFYQQLPGGAPATQGLAVYAQHYGAGSAFPSFVLVTFTSPLRANGTFNTTEFAELASITTLLNQTPGVATVLSPVGPYGAPLATWIAAGSEAPGIQAELGLTLGQYLGSDGRTVDLSVIPSSSGLSAAAVSMLDDAKSSLGAYAAGHPDVTAIAYGGGAAVTADLAAQTATATERMILAVSIGLLVVLFVVLRSVVIPPMAVATIGLSIGWAWGATQLVFTNLLGLSLYFFVPTVLFILILGLGIDYNIFLLTRVREERLRGRSSQEAIRQAVARTGGIISAAAVILGGAFAALTVGDFLLLRAIGFAVAAAVLLDAMVVRTYLVPSALHLMGDRVWRLRNGPAAPPASPEAATPPPPSA